MKVKHKERDAQTLVKSAIQYISQTSLSKGMDAFLEDPSWRKGDLALCILDSKGVILLDTQDSHNIWTTTDNHPDLKTAAKKGGGWVQSIRNDRVFSAYVEKIEINGELFYIQTGFFSYSPEADVLHTINTLVDFYNENGLDATAKAINNQEFEKRGLLFPHLCDISGVCIAFAAHTHMVGKKMYEGEDIEGRPLLQVVQNLLKSPERGGWATHVWTDSVKRIYVKALDDRYFLCSGYFPQLGQDDAIGLVQKGAAFLRSNGPKMAMPEFSKVTGIFVKGYMSVAVFDMTGKLLAAPFKPDWVDQGTDERGINIFKRILEKIEIDGTALISFIEHNKNWTVYAKKVETPDGDFILASGFFPYDKEEEVKTIVAQGVDHFENSTPAHSFKMFMDKKGPFYSGDLYLFVYDMLGNCLVNGPHTDFIWQNFFDFQDQTGRHMIADMINAAQLDDEVWITVKTNNDTRRIFINHIFETLPTQEEGLEVYRSYILGCGYYI